MPKKKKKGGDKEKKVKKKPGLSEREIVTFEQQILDNNKQLTRLRSRNEHLEAEVDALKEQLKKLEDDRSDVVAHLKRILQQKTDESRELGDRLLALEELRKDEQILFKKKEDTMQLEYNTMETNLSAEVKLAAGKLNALEDWRLARLDLMKKFEIQEEKMAEQEERHKKSLYDAEKSLVIGKAKMQKEMEERLNELGKSFREAMNIRIADATHRAVRENIALNLELDAMYKLCRDLDVRVKENKEKERNLRIHASIYKTEARMALSKLIEQNRLIDNLAEDHFNMTLEHGKICREKSYGETKERIVQTYKDLSIDEEEKAIILEQNIEKTEDEREETLRKIKDNCREIKRLENILVAAKCYIAEMAREKIAVEDIRACYCNDLEDKLRILMDILEKPEMMKATMTEDSSIHGLENSDEESPLIRNILSAGISKPEMKQGIEKTEDFDEAEVKMMKKSEIPQCLLEDSQISDLTSPVETETPRSTNSEEN